MSRLAIMVALALGAAGAASANEADTTADVRCLVVVSAMASASPEQQSSAMMAALYYLGRIDGRTPALDLEARLIQETGRFAPKDMAAEGKRCGAHLMSRGTRLQEIGARLSAAAKK
ncbi:hypothetical protein [Phenylobacterium sp.]|jgi:hypothetical protein|uniref:hypothetical protein n=1 Tax=Phenylobacterium sp. TaxID=1871053 RepID=UPI002F952845